jgi:drug/metabolite transporter (DMT)-like permease
MSHANCLPAGAEAAPAAERSSLRIGVLAALLTVVMWTTWTVGSRFAMQGAQPLSPALLAVIRFGTSALLLAPWWWRSGLIPRGVPKLALLGLMIGGLPYQFLVLWGLRYAPASEAGPLLAGTLPLFIGLLSLLMQGEKLSGARIAGILLITLGALAITGTGLLRFADGHWRGHLLVLAAAFSWSLYTVAFRRSGLSGVQAAAFVGLWSVLLLAPFALVPALEGMAQMPVAVLLKHVLIQGIMAGVVALITFTTAVRYLGASRTSAITALTPVAVTLVAMLLLGEAPGLPELTGCLLITSGVVLASGVLRRRAAGA